MIFNTVTPLQLGRVQPGEMLPVSGDAVWQEINTAKESAVYQALQTVSSQENSIFTADTTFEVPLEGKSLSVKASPGEEKETSQINICSVDKPGTILLYYTHLSYGLNSKDDYLTVRNTEIKIFVNGVLSQTVPLQTAWENDKPSSGIVRWSDELSISIPIPHKYSSITASLYMTGSDIGSNVHRHSSLNLTRITYGIQEVKYSGPIHVLE